MSLCQLRVRYSTTLQFHYDFDSLLEVYLVEYIIDDLHDVKNTKTHQRAAVLDYNERT